MAIIKTYLARYLHFHTLITASVLWFGLGWCANNLDAADFVTQVAQAELLLKAGKSEPIQKLMVEVTGQPNGKIYAALMTACMQQASGNGVGATATIAKIGLSDAAWHELPAQVQIAYAETLRRCGRSIEAGALANHLGENSTGMHRARAARVMSDIFADRQQWPEALEWIATAIESGQVNLYGADDQAAMAGLQKRRAEIEQIIEIQIHGLGFRLYRIGNEQRFAGQQQAALATFDRLLALALRNAGKPVVAISDMNDPKIDDLPITPVYVAAAQVYRAECLLALERYRDARDSLSPVIKDASHPYQAEALRLMGDITLDETGDVAAAERNYSSAISALSAANTQARAFDKFRVPDRSKDKTKPPAAMRGYVGWGNLEWFHPEPQQIINADTCDWYADYQTLLAQTKRSMCYFLLGKTDAAVKDLDIFSKVDAADRAQTEKNAPSNYLRLRDGYRLGKFYVTAAEMAEFKGRALVKLVQAEVLFETEQWDAAMAAYARFNDNDQSHLSKGAKAYLEFAQASALVYMGKPGDSKRFTKGFEGSKPLFADTPTYWRALFLLANVNPDQSPELLARGAVKCPDPDVRADFLMQIGKLAYCYKRDDEADKVLKQLIKDLPPSDYRAKSAHEILKMIREGIPQR